MAAALSASTAAAVLMRLMHVLLLLLLLLQIISILILQKLQQIRTISWVQITAQILLMMTLIVMSLLGAGQWCQNCSRKLHGFSSRVTATFPSGCRT
jgi:Na+(H+)/acetate symporter ActP